MQRLIHDLGQLFVSTEVLVVELRVASWIDPTEVLHSIELCHCLTNQVAELQRRAVSKSVE